MTVIIKYEMEDRRAGVRGTLPETIVSTIRDTLAESPLSNDIIDVRFADDRRVS